MSENSFGREVAKELIGKAVVWGPATAGVLLLGPVGVAVGIATTLAILCSGGSDNGSAPNASQSKETGSST